MTMYAVPQAKGLLEKHLKTCEKCQNTYNELKNDSIDSMIKKEADSVLKQHEKRKNLLPTRPES